MLAAVFYVTGRVSRWRLQWLAVPVGVGLLWMLAIGPSRAVSGLTAGPRQVLAYLGGIGQHPGHLLHLTGAFAGLTHWLPEQFPLALILAAAEAFCLCWLQMCWRQRAERAWRTGVVVAARRRWTTASLRAGGVVSSDGCLLGVDVITGRPAAVSWPEAEGGVLCAGPGADAVAVENLSAEAQSGFRLAHAAIRRRKPVIVIDLAGSAFLAESLAAACVEPGAPLSCFGPAGPGCYEPLRGGDPARAAGMVMAMLDWSETGDQQRRSCAAYLTDALAVQAAAPRDRRVPLFDDLAHLLTPAGLRERAALIPSYHPRRDVLVDRAAVSADLLEADPATVAAPAAQLARLRASALGQWLRPPPPGGARVSLGQTVRERGVTLFSLDRGVHGRSAQQIAALAAADLLTVCAELQGMSVPGDSLVWISGCEALGPPVLAELVARGRGAGMAVVLGTASASVAERLAAEVNVLVASGPVAPALAAQFTGAGPDVTGTGAVGAGGPVPAGAVGLGGEGLVPAGMAGLGGEGLAPVGSAAGLGAEAAGMPGEMSAGWAASAAGVVFGRRGVAAFPADGLPLGADAFALLSRAPRRRVLTRCRHVPAHMGGTGAVRRGVRGVPGTDVTEASAA